MNKQFIAYLSNKLKTGNLNSIHLNALPGRLATRIDLCNLNIINGIDDDNLLFEAKGEKISSDFLFNNLLAKPKFQYKINFEKAPIQSLLENDKKKFDILAKKLNAIVNQDEDNFLEHGIKTFSFGFPLLVKRSRKEPNKIIKAPIIIWNLDIQRSNSVQNQWTLELTEDSPVYVNEMLISHLANDENISIGDISIDILEDGLIDQKEILQIVNDILVKCNSKTSEETIKIEACRDKESVDNATSNGPWIQWSGIFGLFKTQKQSIIKDSDLLFDNFEDQDFNEILHIQPRTSNNTSVATDPSQEEIINTIDQKEYKVIQGPPGTGKSQSLTAIITNTLENNKKILVVCEKKTALDVIFNNLQILGLDKLAAIIDDVNRDRKPIIDTVRAIAETEKPVATIFNENEYDKKLSSFHEMVTDFNNRHHNLLKIVFQGYNVQDIISEYLELKKSIDKNDRILYQISFQFTDIEYNELSALIEKAVDLYEEIPENAFVYNLLSTENFTNPYSVQIENQIIERLNSEIGFLQDIEIAYFLVSEAHFEKLPAHLLKQYEHDVLDNFSFNIQALLTFWRNLSAELQKTYMHINSSNLLNANPLSNKITEFYTLYDNIVSHTTLITKIAECLYLISLAYDKMPAECRTGKVKFSALSQFLGPVSKKHRAILAFQNTFNQQFESINLLITNNAMIITNLNLINMIREFIPTKNDITDLIQDLNLCIENQKYYKEYHNWRFFYDPLNTLAYETITKLSLYASFNQWASLFKLNYINLLLESNEKVGEQFNINSKSLDRIGELEADLKSLHRHKILKIWEQKRYQSIAEYNKKSNIKWLYNYRKNSQYAKRNTLRSIIHDDFDLFTDIFPVVLVNPVVCSSILPLKHHLFEIVLFDEASQLRLEDTYPALVRGKIKVISGDKHQMPPSNYFSSDISLDIEETLEEEPSARSNFDKTNPLYLAESESLLDFANSLNPNMINISFLDFHYRSRHPYLIDFSNAAFYGERLIPMPEKNSYKPIHFTQVNGLYRTNNTNLNEALKIIEYLKSDYPVNSAGEYPSLGIATFNMQQRNLIKDLINEECIKDEEFRLKMNQIGKEVEWFVKNLENIQGDERDIIIISTTFGLNTEGKFRQNFGPINGAKGYKLLNVIITRAKKQIHVFTSIPEEYISSYQAEIRTNGNKGKAILYAYLDYCSAVEKGNEGHRQIILKILQQACEEKTLRNNGQQSQRKFEKEVYDYLSKFIHPERIVPHYKLGGYQLDFVLLNESKKPSIAIECDGAQWHSTNQAYSHDLHREKILELQGIHFYRIWSKSWWPNPDKEIEKLVKFIGGIDGSILAS